MLTRQNKIFVLFSIFLLSYHSTYEMLQNDGTMLCETLKCPKRYLCKTKYSMETNKFSETCNCLCKNEDGCEVDKLDSSKCLCDKNLYANQCDADDSYQKSSDCNNRDFDEFCAPGCEKYQFQRSLCSTTAYNPWSNCSKGTKYCASKYDNGVCDVECNNPGCLFDGGDCKTTSVCKSCINLDGNEISVACKNFCRGIRGYYSRKYEENEKSVSREFEALLQLKVPVYENVFDFYKIAVLEQLSEKFSLLFQVYPDTEGDEVIFSQYDHHMHSTIMVIGITRKNCLNHECVYDAETISKSIAAISIIFPDKLAMNILQVEYFYKKRHGLETLKIIAIVFVCIAGGAFVFGVLHSYKGSNRDILGKGVCEEDQTNDSATLSSKFEMVSTNNSKRKLIHTNDIKKRSKISDRLEVIETSKNNDIGCTEKNLETISSAESNSDLSRDIDFTSVESHILTLVDKDNKQKSIICRMNTRLLMEMDVPKLIFNDILNNKDYKKYKKINDITLYTNELRSNTVIHDAIKCDLYLNMNELKKIPTFFLNFKNEQSFTPLILSVIFSRHEWIKFLCNNGASVDTKDERKKTALHWAAAVNDVVAIRLLKLYKINLNCQSYVGETPLMIACQEGRIEALLELIKMGADIFLKDFMNQNCITVAVKNDRKSIVMIFRDLLQHPKFDQNNTNVLKFKNAIFNFLKKNKAYVNLVNIKIENIKKNSQNNYKMTLGNLNQGIENAQLSQNLLFRQEAQGLSSQNFFHVGKQMKDITSTQNYLNIMLLNNIPQQPLAPRYLQNSLNNMINTKDISLSSNPLVSSLFNKTYYSEEHINNFGCCNFAHSQRPYNQFKIETPCLVQQIDHRRRPVPLYKSIVNTADINGINYRALDTFVENSVLSKHNYYNMDTFYNQNQGINHTIPLISMDNQIQLNQQHLNNYFQSLNSLNFSQSNVNFQNFNGDMISGNFCGQVPIVNDGFIHSVGTLTDMRNQNIPLNVDHLSINKYNNLPQYDNSVNLTSNIPKDSHDEFQNTQIMK